MLRVDRRAFSQAGKHCLELCQLSWTSYHCFCHIPGLAARQQSPVSTTPSQVLTYPCYFSQEQVCKAICRPQDPGKTPGQTENHLPFSCCRNLCCFSPFPSVLLLYTVDASHMQIYTCGFDTVWVIPCFKDFADMIRRVSWSCLGGLVVQNGATHCLTGSLEA